MSKEDLDRLQHIPWCARLLNDPQHTVEPTFSRNIKSTGEDALFGSTLKTDSTISACATFYKTPSASLAEGNSNANTDIPEVYTIATLEGGLDGWPQICHGGIVVTLLDEAMGALHSVNKTLESERAKARGQVPLPERPATLTAQLDVKCIKPVMTPQTVLLTATLTRMEGRKRWMSASIKDGDGEILATGEAFFITIGRSKI